MPASVEQRIIAQIYVDIDGAAAPEALVADIVRVTVESSVHLPDLATLEIHNPNLRWSDQQQGLKVGQGLQIRLGNRERREEVFDGEVNAIEIEFDISGETRLLVTAYDRAHRLHRGRFTRAFTKMTDSDIVKKIAGELSFSTDVESTSEVHDYVLQNNQTNWEFLEERAARLGFELVVQKKKLFFKPPPSVEADDVSMTLHDQLLSFRARMTTSEQVSEVEVRGWDPLNKKEVVGRAKQPRLMPKIGERRTGADVASEAFHTEARIVVAHEPVYSQAQADKLAQAALDDVSNTFVTAEGVAMGNPLLRLGSKVRITAVGDRFSGTYVATEVRHVYEQTGYQIEFKASGRRSTDMMSLLRQRPPQPMSLLTGIVSNNKDDRDVGRVKVKMPLLGADIESDWCRVVTPGAGPQRGMEYLPEVDDEVLVVGSDINHLYVLGGIWNVKDAPPEKNGSVISGGRVTKRIIRSRTGHVILIDDSDDGGNISIIDSSGNNKVIIDTKNKSIELKAEGDIKIHAGGALKLTSGTEVKVKAGTELKAESGTSATIEAQTDLSLSGATQAKLQSNAITEVKGPMVNIGQ
jgi:phage protein D